MGNGWSPDSGDNKGLYDNGDTGTSLFPEFKPRGFTKSEPMQRRTLKTGIPSKWNAAYEGTNGDSSELSELKSKMSEFKSLWVANEKKKELDEVERHELAEDKCAHAPSSSERGAPRH